MMMIIFIIIIIIIVRSSSSSTIIIIRTFLYNSYFEIYTVNKQQRVVNSCNLRLAVEP